MSWFDPYAEEWKEIIDAVFREFSVQKKLIEKDIVQSMLLHDLSQSGIPLVFKGGTSLSKAYRLINRFSEDIDLSASRKLSSSEKRKTKEAILASAEKLGLVLANPEMVKSRHDYNLYEFDYESLYGDNHGQILVETSFYQVAYPSNGCEVGSYVGLFCRKNGKELPIPFPASSFMMDVQSLERTFVDKVFAACDYRLANMENRDSRHLYDIYKLLPKVVLDDDMRKLVDEVRKDRMFSKNNPSAQPEHDIPSMLKEIAQSRFFAPDYEDFTKRLLYEKADYDTVVEKGIMVIAQSDVFSYRG